jgi:hypothetical protein
MAVDVAYAEWLQAPARTIVQSDGTLTARWGSRAGAAEIDCAFDSEADALAEAIRQISFYGGPLVEETAIVNGLIDLNTVRGKTITLTLPGDPVFGAGVVVFVLGGVPDEGTGITTLFVLRRL